MCIVPDAMLYSDGPACLFEEQLEITVCLDPPQSKPTVFGLGDPAHEMPGVPGSPVDEKVAQLICPAGIEIGKQVQGRPR